VSRSPGWYPDPSNPEKLKWWNGSAWTNEPQTQSGIPASPSGYLAPPSVQSAPSFSGQDNPGFNYGTSQGPKMVSFEDSVRIGLSKYATFSGRATRSEYWFFTLFYSLVVLGTFWLSIIFDNELFAFITLATWLALFLPAISALVRRLHDTGKSGWWYWLSLVPFGGIVVIVFLCQQSESSPNAYGPAPLTS
jgi:uncharacterized membrane protein YhaH (DUF805 family)